MEETDLFELLPCVPNMDLLTEIQWKWTNVNLKFKLVIERQNQWPKNEFANGPL